MPNCPHGLTPGCSECEWESGKLPLRIQLSRAKGWRMPPNTVKVDRTTKWGNPFIVGQDGTAAKCVQLYRCLLGIGPCLSCKADVDVQLAARRHVLDHWRELKGLNLACWCRPGAACHADVLLEIAANA